MLDLFNYLGNFKEESFSIKDFSTNIKMSNLFYRDQYYYSYSIKITKNFL